MGVLVHWSVLLKRGFQESRKLAIHITQGHNQGPGRTGLGLQITVSRETVAAIVVQLVDAAFRGAFEKVIKTGGGTEFISLLFSCFRTGVSLENIKKIIKLTALQNKSFSII